LIVGAISMTLCIGPLTAEPLNLKFTIINTIDTSVYAT